jgi:Ca2+:H+ antiporter
MDNYPEPQSELVAQLAGRASVTRVVGREWPLLLSILTTVLFRSFSTEWFADLSDPLWFVFLLAWLFAVTLLSSFAIVRHAEQLAVRLGEPLGTLVLTLSVTGIEVAIITAAMFTGNGNPALARDSMFAVIMIVLNGMVGLSLLLGALRHHEQEYNLQGATAFLSVIMPLAVFGLILPNFTVTTPGPTYSPLQAMFLVVMSLALYTIFLMIQNLRHRPYFLAPSSGSMTEENENEAFHVDESGQASVHHMILLLVYLFPLVLLAKQLAIPLDYGIRVLGAPPGLGGVVIAALVLSPESFSAVRAALSNHLQRAVNILLGSVLATIGLTIPAVLSIGLLTGKSIILGLDAVNMTLLLLTLILSTLTFSSSRTNVLLGAVHLLLFFAYAVFIFEK